MSKYNIDVAYRKTVLGEGPHWVASKQELIYVDIFGKAVHRYTPSTGEDIKVEFDKRVTLIVPLESDPNRYIISLERDLTVLDWSGKSGAAASLRKLKSLDEDNPTNRINDGKCDNQGRLWAGTMGSDDVNTPGKVAPCMGSLYKLDLNGDVSSHLDSLDIGNGLAWSLDNTVMYYIDSYAYTVDALDFDASAGTIANRRSIYDFKLNGITGIPDGMTIDTNGNLWVCNFGGGRILHIDPAVGKRISTIEMPTKNITSVAFGGANLDELYATSAAVGLTAAEEAAQPDAGCLFKITNTGAKGVAGGVAYKGSIK